MAVSGSLMKIFQWPKTAVPCRRNYFIQCLLRVYSVEKLEKKGGMFFCRKPKYSTLLVAADM